MFCCGFDRLLIIILTILHYSAFNVLGVKIFLGSWGFLNSTHRTKLAEAAMENGNSCCLTEGVFLPVFLFWVGSVIDNLLF